MEQIEEKKTPSEGDRILGNGTRVKLRDGSYQNLVLDFEAIVTLEDKYGSLEGFVGVLQKEGGKRFTAIRDAMVACLAHTSLSEEEISKGLVFKEFQNYVDALTGALEEGMPEGAVAPPLPMNRNGFRGRSFTGRRQSSSGGRTKSSKG